MELLVAVLIISVLALSAIPTYGEYIKRSRVENLKSWLLEAAAAQERHFTSRGHYTPRITDLNDFGLKNSLAEGVKLITGIQFNHDTGLSFWVAGNADIDKSPETYNECWVYMGRNSKQSGEHLGNFVQLWDDRKDEPASSIPPGITLDGACK